MPPNNAPPKINIKDRAKKGLPMLFNSLVVALLLAIIIACICTGLNFIAIDQATPLNIILSEGLIALITSFVFIYITLEFLIFREINRIYSVLEKLKKKDFKLVRKSLKGSSSLSPIRKINNELFTFASKKEAEIIELKNLETFRREFLQDVSHELKTPIFAAQGFIHTLLDGAMDDTTVRERFLRKAANSLDGLDAMVQDLISISQMESGLVSMHYTNVEAIGLMQEVVDQLENKAAQRKVTITHDIKDRSLTFYADRNRLRQAVSNLVENAIKYGSEKGNVVISADADKDFSYIAVKDDGPGIESDHLRRIFERFYRVEKSRSKDSGGSGLGLAIVKHIIEAHYGKINVTSKIGKGTTFTIKLRKQTAVATKQLLAAGASMPSLNVIYPLDGSLNNGISANTK